jgi:dihydrolipoamide dehydrogenase
VSDHFDVVVLGAGPGGYIAAIRAAQLGMKTAIVEERYWGGVCLNVGCIPTKSLLKNAELAHAVLHQAELFGISGATVDYGVAFDRSRTVSENIVKGVHYLLKKYGVTEIHGTGHFLDPKTIEVDSRVVTFDNCVIATGAQPKPLGDVAFSDTVVSYRELVLSRELPKTMAIVGAGAIGMEFGFVLASYGVEVTIIEFLDRVLPNEDAEVSRELAKQYKRLGVKVLTKTSVTKVEDQGTSVCVTYDDGRGTPTTLQVDRLLVSVGFAPNVNGFGLEQAGVGTDANGSVTIDGHMRTTVDGIYAVGDVTGKLQLAHVAEAQGVIAAETIAGQQPAGLEDYRMMPRVTFCQPQVASFGWTEEAAAAAGFDCQVVRFPFKANGKAQALGATAGFVKLVTSRSDATILGAHMVGSDVSELLPELTLAAGAGLTAHDLTRNVHTHPTLSEALQEVFHGAVGQMLNL